MHTMVGVLLFNSLTTGTTRSHNQVLVSIVAADALALSHQATRISNIIVSQ